MADEREYLMELFYKSFSKYKEKKIVLYGTGPNTKIILDEIKDFNFLGIMDGVRKDGTIYGYDIIDYEGVLDRKADAIIIIARENSTRIIYNRISKFCLDNNILVFNFYGEDLAKKNKNFDVDNPYFHINEEELIKKISDYDVISFDVFDTLIMRKVLFPDDVFEIMGKKIGDDNFSKLRRECMQEVINGDLFEIYNRYQKINNISDIDKDRLIDLELSIEKNVLVCRNRMVELLRYAVSIGKKVYLISDMYFPKDILRDILYSLNIKGFEDIFVSCDYKLLKSQGLFKEYVKKIKASSYLHIGDSADSDGTYAKINGIDVFLIKSSYDMFSISVYKEVEKEVKNLQERNMLGMFIERAFNNPFSLYNSRGRLKIEELNDVGYLFIAPLITSFMIWFIDRIKEYDKVILPSRDGYLISKLYKILNKNGRLPEYSYILTSRLATVSASIYNEDDLFYASEYSFGGTPDQLLKKRFFLADEEVLKYKDEELGRYVFNHYDKIIKKSEELRENYLEYLRCFDIKGNIAFFDFIASGTCQRCLNKILNINSDGFYFARILRGNLSKESINAEGFFSDINELEQDSINIYRNYLFLEYIMTSAEPSISHFSAGGKPVFLEECRSKKQLDYIKEIQDAIILYFEEYLKFEIKEYVSHNFVDVLFGFIEKQYTDIKDDILNNIAIQDEFCNRAS